MIKQLEKISGKIYRWKIALNLPTRRVHTHVELTSEDAHAMYAELLKEKAAAKIGLTYKGASSTAPLTRACAEYERHIVAIGQEASHVRSVVRSLALLQSVAPSNATVQHVTRHTLQDFMRARQAQGSPKPSTVNKARREISAFLGWCVKNGWAESNPVSGIEQLKQEPPPLRFVEWSDYQKFADAAWKYRKDMALAIEVTAETGARINEVLKATAADVSVQGGVWSKLVKGGRRILVAAGPWTIAAAKQAKTPDAPLCPRQDGKHFRYSAFTWAFPIICDKAGIKRITPHYLRHGRGTWDANAGVPAIAIQRQLGHTTIATTERYMRAATAKDFLSHKRTNVRSPKNFVRGCDKSGPNRAKSGKKGRPKKRKSS